MSNDSHKNDALPSLKKYKSPIKKLAASFLRSRDSIRNKHDALKKKLKSYTIKIRDLSESRNKWKAVAKQLEKKLKELRKEKERKKKTPGIDTEGA